MESKYRKEGVKKKKEKERKKAEPSEARVGVVQEALDLQTAVAYIRHAMRKVPDLLSRAPAYFEVLTTHKIKSITMRIITLFLPL